MTPTSSSKASSPPATTFTASPTRPAGLLSRDGLVCRHVHVGDDGTIDVAYDGLENGAACQHPCKFAVTGGLTLQLVPFDDGPSHTYHVELAQAEDFADAVADAFFVGVRP